MQKTYLLFLIVIFSITNSSAQNGRNIQYSSAYFTLEDTAKITCFNQAYKGIENMLAGKDSLDYERAVFLTENAYWDNQMKYEDFKAILDYHTDKIKLISQTIKTDKNNRNKIADNRAIFNYMTDTTWLIENGQLYCSMPLRYAHTDPYGTQHWRNSQVFNLLNPSYGEGNCYAMVSLFKIFSERLKTNAFITIAPYHVYIQHKDFRGDYYNVELPTRTFPSDGTIKTLTYTTHDGVLSGIEMRKLDLKESIALCLIYLAKGYEYKYGEKGAQFVLKCSNLVLKYDSLNLNAMLLKASVMEEAVIKYMKRKNITDVKALRSNAEVKSLFSDYEKWMFRIYKLGYREIPHDMEKLIMAGIRKREEGIPTKDYTPDPFPGLKTQNLRYATLSNGLFDEAHLKTDYITYSRTTLKTEAGKITSIEKMDSTKGYKIDPIIFAWSVDPLARKYPGLSPYVAFANNPILFIDPDGADIVPTVTRQYQQEGTTVIEITISAEVAVLSTTAGIDAHGVASGIEENLKREFSGTYEARGLKYVFKAGVVNVRAVKSASEVASNQHLVTIVDDATGTVTDSKGNTGPAGGWGKIGGKVSYVEKASNVQTMVETAIHELGHNFGLQHNWTTDMIDDDNEDKNYMSYSGSKSDFSPQQLQDIWSSFNNGKLNKGSTTKTLAGDDYSFSSTTQDKPYSHGNKGDKVPVSFQESGKK